MLRQVLSLLGLTLSTALLAPSPQTHPAATHHCARLQESVTPSRNLPYLTPTNTFQTAAITPTALNSAPPSVVPWVGGALLGGNLGTFSVIWAVKTWYNRIPLPEWNPPNKVFAPVWTTLYVCMGVAASRVSSIAGFKSPAIKLALIHFALNITWTRIFFGMKKLRLAHVWNFFLIPTLAGTIRMFYRIDRVAGYLLLPYMGWMLFATKLNSAICKLNPTVDGYNNAMLEDQICKLWREAAERVGIKDYFPVF